MARIRVITNCVADTYVDKERERIVEFNDREISQGGLISFRRQKDGSLDVYLYRLDARVRVHVDPKHRGPETPEPANETAWREADI